MESLYSDGWDEHIGRFRAPFAFRGVSNSDWDMQTSLIRLGGDYIHLEQHLLRGFRKYAHRNVVEGESFWHWLTIAQHHGLPTRLLDWTFSPLVALHFATVELREMTYNGVVYRVDYTKIHKRLPADLKHALSKERCTVFTVEMLSDLSRNGFDRRAEDRPLGKIQSLNDFDNLGDEPFALFFEPPSMDDRIVNQYALFSVLSDPALQMDIWLENNSDVYKKIIIPAELKWEVRDKLDQSNMTERVLFPGLDGLSQWLTRHYSPGKLKYTPDSGKQTD